MPKILLVLRTEVLGVKLAVTHGRHFSFCTRHHCTVSRLTNKIKQITLLAYGGTAKPV